MSGKTGSSGVDTNDDHSSKPSSYIFMLNKKASQHDLDRIIAAAKQGNASITHIYRQVSLGFAARMSPKLAGKLVQHRIKCIIMH